MYWVTSILDNFGTKGLSIVHDSMNDALDDLITAGSTGYTPLIEWED